MSLPFEAGAAVDDASFVVALLLVAPEVSVGEAVVEADVLTDDASAGVDVSSSVGAGGMGPLRRVTRKDRRDENAAGGGVTN